MYRRAFRWNIYVRPCSILSGESSVLAEPPGFSRGRVAVEREFGRLKHDYGLAPLRGRGVERVQLHADLVMLGRLAQALTRARAVPLAA